jgi:hypothetical protein
MRQNCGRKLENGACTPQFEPRGAVARERGYLQHKNGLEMKLRILC